MPEHTPILWTYNETRGMIETVSGGYAIEPRGLTGRRMVEDHNACADMNDPAAALKLAREALGLAIVRLELTKNVNPGDRIALEVSQLALAALSGKA